LTIIFTGYQTLLFECLENLVHFRRHLSSRE